MGLFSACSPLLTSIFCTLPVDSQFLVGSESFSICILSSSLYANGYLLFLSPVQTLCLRHVSLLSSIFFPFLSCLCVFFLSFNSFSFILLCTTSSLYIISPFAALHLYCSHQILITSLYQRCQPSRRHYFHVMKLTYNPFKAVKLRLNINTPHY